MPMKSKPSSLSLILLMNVLFMPACGGGGSDGTAVSSSPASPPTAAAVTPATPVPTTPAAPSPAGPPPTAASPTAGVAIAGGYPPTSLTCSQGSPMYWTRDWMVLFNGGVFRFTPGVGSVREHVWNAAPQSGQ